MKAPAAISTKAARRTLATRLRNLAEGLGANVIVTEPSIWDRNGIDIEFVFGAYRCGMDFVPSMWAGAYLAHWYTADKTSTYPAEFGASIRGTVNSCHHAKATTCEDTLGGFLASLTGGLTCLNAQMGNDHALLKSQR